MGRTIAQLRSDITRKLHGTNINHVQGEFEVYAEASRAVLSDIDFYETKRIQSITNEIYAGVYDYSLPTDLKGNKIIDIRPQTERQQTDFPQQNYTVEFDRYKEKDTFNIRDNSGFRNLRYSKNVGYSTVLHNSDSLDNNGNWVADDDATNINLDTLNYVTSGASIRFDVDGSTTTASIVNDGLGKIDLTDYKNIGAFFVNVYMPSVITNITLTWGNDASNYYTKTVTQPQYNAFVVGWNLIRFDWRGATSVGTPDTDITYLKLSIEYDGLVNTDYRVSKIICSVGKIYEIEYYSKFMFRNNAGLWIEEPSNLTDVIVLDQEGYNCYLYKVLELLAPDIQAENASFDYAIYEKKYLSTKFAYQSKYKSEIRLPVQYYYKPYGKI
jgi:hypothetical protein